MAGTNDIDSALLEHLNERGTVTMEEMIRHFHQCTFNQVFTAIDRLSRNGSIHLTRHQSFDYTISRIYQTCR